MKMKMKIFFTLFFMHLLSMLLPQTIFAQESYTIVELKKSDTAIDLTSSMQLYKQQGDVFIVETVPDAAGVINQIEVHATSENPSGNWIRFAIANTGEEQIDRLIVAPHFRLAGSGIWWPDLGKKRIYEIVPSEGFQLQRQADLTADIFRVTLNPGTIVTFIGELASDDVPHLTLWHPDSYKDAVNSYTLYEGIIIGIAGLLALFLTIIFLVKSAAMFPAAALFAWSVLAYVCTDFGFVAKVLLLTVEGQNAARALIEVFLTISFAIFVFAYLHLHRWHTQYSYILGVSLLVLAGLAAITIFSPGFSAGSARIAFSAIIVAGLFLLLFLSWQSFDRAILLFPTWIMMVAWMVGFGMAAIGEINNDVIQHGLSGALVLILLLVAFTVLQHAFAGDAIAPYLISNVERQAVALAGSGATLWDWEIERDEIFVGSKLTNSLGRADGELNCSANGWLKIVHPQDRERFKIVLEIVIERRKGKIEQDFRLQANNGEYQWWRIEARPMIGSDGETVRCVGTIRNVSRRKVAQENLLQNATHDKLTGLPNIELFQDRVNSAISIASAGTFGFSPSLLFIDIDGFDELQQKFSQHAQDLIVITTANRISNVVINQQAKLQNSVARVGHNKFAVLIISQSQAEQVAKLAEEIQTATSEPLKLEEKPCEISVSIGVASWAQTRASCDEFMRDCESAMYYAKKLGGGKIVPFQMAYRVSESQRESSVNQLREEIKSGEVKISYRPIVHVKSRKLAGFEAIIESEFLSQLSNINFNKKELLRELHSFILTRVVTDLARWGERFPKNNIFVSINIENVTILNKTFIGEVEKLLRVNMVLPSKLKLEISESTVMQNPPRAISMLQKLRALGVGIALDNFGEGYSSFSHLGKFSFDALKISSSYLDFANKGVGNENILERNVLLKYIIAMAHELKLQTIADGVADEVQFKNLKKIGCQYVQGKFFGEPFPTEMVEAVLAKRL